MEPEIIISSTSPANPSLSVIRRVLTVISIEPGVFLCTFAFGLQMTISQNLIIDKVCNVNLRLNSSICDDLTNYKDEQAQVQLIASKVSMYLTIFATLPTILTSLVLGPWSDRHGRKPIMVGPMIGFLIYYVMLILNVIFVSWTAEMNLLSGLGFAFGGFSGFCIGIFSYISDISDVSTRTSRVALINLAFSSGLPIGNLIGGQIFASAGYYTIFGLALVSTLLGMLYIICYIEETVTSDPEAIRASIVSMAIEAFSSFFRPRGPNVRCVVVLLISTMTLVVATSSFSNLFYLYTRYEFSWTEQHYTVWNSCSSILAISAYALVPLLSFKFGLLDSTIGIIGALSGIASSLVMAFSMAPWMLYLGSAVGIFSSVVSIIIRSNISKIIPSQDLGKVFSVLGSVESVVPLVVAPLMTLIYNSTLLSFSGSIFACNALFYFLALVILLTVNMLSKVSDFPNLEDDDLGIITQTDDFAILST